MMAARVGNLTKLDHAINAVLMLTHVSQTFQDNLGLLVFSHTVHLYLPPAKGRGQHARFLQALYSVQPELCYVNYREAFQYLIGRHPKRALTMVFTDLLDTRRLGGVPRRVQPAAALPPAADAGRRRRAAAGAGGTIAGRPGSSCTTSLVARDLLHGRAELLKGLERQGAPCAKWTGSAAAAFDFGVVALLACPLLLWIFNRIGAQSRRLEPNPSLS